jgi:hypothetical protein
MSMAAIEWIVFASAAGFALVVVIVIIGVHQEERYLTLTDRTAPSAIARLARLVLGRYVRKEGDRRRYRSYPDDLISSRDRRVGPRS